MVSKGRLRRYLKCGTQSVEIRIIYRLYYYAHRTLKPQFDSRSNIYLLLNTPQIELDLFTLQIKSFYHFNGIKTIACHFKVAYEF